MKYWACKNGETPFVAQFDYTDRFGTCFFYKVVGAADWESTYEHQLDEYLSQGLPVQEAERKAIASDKIEGPFGSYQEALEFAEILD